MKKLTIFLLLIFVSMSCLLTACKNDNTIRLNEVTHSIFYAPLYVAINNGYFEDENINIELTNGGGSDVSMTAVLSNSADIALVGPETAVYVVNQGRENHPVIFGQLTKRDGSFLVGRTPEPNFDWSNLDGKHLIAGRRGGSPAMSLQYALEQNGYDIENDLTFDLNVAFNMTTGAFEGGLGDYVTMFEPLASAFQSSNRGYIVASVGEESGEIPFTCFVANQSYLDSNPLRAEAFLRAVKRGYDFIVSSPIDSVVESLRPSFVGTTDQDIKASIQSYIRIDAWCSTPVMTANAFDKLQDMLINAGELTNKVSYSETVDNTYAYKV